MDKTDIALLQILREDARQPIKSIAQKLYISAPAVAARMEKLQDEGYITGYTVSLDRKKLGYPITAYIKLELAHEKRKNFNVFIHGCKNVLECACVTGEYSMLIKVAFESTESLERFVTLLQEYGRTDTQIVFSTLVDTRCELYGE